MCCGVVQCVSVCWRVLQCVAVRFECVMHVLRCAAVYCSVLQCVSVYRSVLQCAVSASDTFYDNVLQCVAVCCSVLQCVAVCWECVRHVLRLVAAQCVAVCCRVLQCVVVCCTVVQSVAVCCRSDVAAYCIVLWVRKTRATHNTSYVAHVLRRTVSMIYKIVFHSSSISILQPPLPSTRPPCCNKLHHAATYCNAL